MRQKILSRKTTAFVLALLFFPCFLRAGERYALVIGNAAYTNIEKLNTPVNDARDVTEALAFLGFKVDLRINAGIDEMEEAIYHFAGLLSADRENEGFFWYAGHGVQADGENFLLPVDIRAERISQVKRMSCSMGDLLAELENARNMVNVVILDACRNNPLPVESRGLSRGLAAAPAVQDTFIMFSTAAGATADDGGAGARNSPFTQAFLNCVITPQPLDSLAKDISRETIALTQSNQRPFISDNILYLKNYSLHSRPGEGDVTAVVRPTVAPFRPAEERPASGEAGKFSLDNVAAWSVALSFASNPDMGFNSLHPGAALRYSFWERFKTQGDFFILPNEYYFNAQFGMNHFETAVEKPEYYDFILGLGAQWKFRPGSSQRFFLSAGLSANVFLGNISYGFYNGGYVEASDFFLEPMAGFHGGGAFRITPTLALELSAAYYLDVLGSFTVPDGTVYSFNFFQASLGLSFTLPYGGSR
jgi:hypothetical protein